MAEITAKLVQDLRERTGLGMMQCKKALGETNGDVDAAIELMRKQGAAVAAKRAGKEAKEGRVLLAKSSQAAVAVEVNCETDFVSASDDFKKFSDTALKIVLEKMPADVDTLKAVDVGGMSLGQRNTDIIAKIGENIGVRRFVIEKLGTDEQAEVYSHMGGKIGVIVKVKAVGEAKDPTVIAGTIKDLCMQVAALSPVSVDKSSVPDELIEKEKEIYRAQTLAEGKPEKMLENIVQGRLSKFFKESCLVQQSFVKDNKQTIEQMLAAVAKEQGLTELKVVSFQRMQLGA